MDEGSAPTGLQGDRDGRVPSGDAAFSEAARGAVRLIAQSRLMPSNLRLIDASGAATTMAGDGSATLLIIGFRIPRPAGRRPHGPGRGDRRGRGRPGCFAQFIDPVRPGRQQRGGEDEAGADRWRSAFLMAPYMRDTFVACGIIAETFETAITWDRFEEFHRSVIETTRRAVAGSPAPRAKAKVPRGSAVASPTSTRTAPPPLHGPRACPTRQRGSPVGRNPGRRLRPRTIIETAERSPTTTRWAGTTAPGTTSSARPVRRCPHRRQVSRRPRPHAQPGRLID